MAVVEVKECNVCESKDIFPFYSLNEFPIIRPLQSAEGMLGLMSQGIPSAMPLSVGICRSCGHIFLLKRPSNKILDQLYESCYMTYLSSLELGFGTVDDDAFLAKFRQYVEPDLSIDSRVLEIGCFDGYILHHLAKDGLEVCGCDPSDGARFAQESGIPIVRAFYSPSLFPVNHFDVVINRHLIEHINNPVELLASFREIVKEAGYIITETPNGAYYLQHGLFDAFSLEHLSVFTPISLSICIKKAGLSINRMFYEERNLVAICTVKPQDKPNDMNLSNEEELVSQAVMFNARVNSYISRVKILIQDIEKRKASVAIWGAGGFGVTFWTMARTFFNKAVTIVDRDPRKHGLNFFNLDLKVMPPEYLQDNPVDYIMVCSQFGDEIIHDIRDRYRLHSDIVLLSPEIQIVR